tara:strand:- start:156 stop:446 length:291 start_codon:yes stop_codon:yes gene_type:complete
MKHTNTRHAADIDKFKRDMIKKDLFECFLKLEKEATVIPLIKQHKKLINSLELKGKKKNKYKTLQYLIDYKNSKDKVHLLSCFFNMFNNLNYLSNK